MHVITARNAHEALPRAIHQLRREGIREDSRNGPVLRWPTPVTTVLTCPTERLTFYPWRDSNPFFLNVEALWMLAGRDDLKPLTQYVKRMADYSDDGGKTSPGAYGKRWRGWFHQSDSDVLPAQKKFDQLNWAVKRLSDNPNDRRVVIQMWDADVDPHRADKGGKDVPCNLTVLPWIQDKQLHLTVFNRSNDIIWGLYSANAVQFSTLLEYLAGRLGLGCGTLTTVSNNFHMYESSAPTGELAWVDDPYFHHKVDTPPLMDLWQREYNDAKAEAIFQEDLAMVFEYKPEEVQLKARSAYIRQVTAPLMIAHKHFSKGTGEDRYLGALDILTQMNSRSDWFTAAYTWINRRLIAYQRKQEGVL